MRTASYLLSKTFVVLLAFLVTGCGTIKAYPGPERPEHELAIITRSCMSAGELGNSYLDGIEFCSNDIAVLPGEHKLSASRIMKGQPYNCRSYDRFDSAGYDTCRDEREEEIRKGRSARSCDTYSYTKTVTECMVEHTEYSCNEALNLRAGGRYSLVAEPNDLERGLTLFSSTGERPRHLSCIYRSTWTTNQEM